ncbi:MAG: urease accessory protein UreF [Deltaproteobacteria bacterium]|nr:urease accessory protein UreF [Deltaproteobacteria bacterium]
MDSRLLQLADSAFPSGSFAHSLGLEALRQLGGLRGEEQLALRLRELCWHTAHGALPFLNDAHGNDPIAADRAADIFLSQHVANRASRAQGQAFLLAAEAAFDNASVTSLRGSLPCGHVAVAVGAALKLAGFSLDDARRLFLFSSVRSALSAAVRLGVVGPLRGQKLLFELHPELDRALASTQGFTGADAASIAPLVDCAQGAQDRLYSRLFQS